MVSKVEEAPTSPKEKRGRVVLELSAAALLLGVLTMLFANITLMCLAGTYNTKVCLDAARKGAQAAADGADDEAVAKAVESAVERNRSGFFVAETRLEKLKFASAHGRKCLVVNTVTVAKLPAPLLLSQPADRPDGFMVYSWTCYIALAKSS